tara:strand:+ start:5934 stop:7067 length:1134 start_codon:yes stop_codon:yes gene_type:complete
MGDPAKYEPPTVDLSKLRPGLVSALATVLSMGGSTVAKILLGEWGGPHGAYLTLTGRGEPVEGDQLTRGHDVEPLIAELSRPMFGDTEVVEVWGQGTFKRTPTMHATPDRLLIRDGGVVGHLELKSVNNQHRALYIDSREGWGLQCQHTNWVLDGALRAGPAWDYRGMNESTLVALAAPEPVFDHLRRLIREKGLDAATEEARELVVSGVAELQIRHVGIEPSYAQETVPKLEAWFEKHVIGDTPPPVDDTKECGRALDLRVGRREGDMPMCENVAALGRKTVEIKGDIKALKAELQLNENKLKLVMGPVKRAYDDTLSVTISDRKGPSRLNQKRAKELLEAAGIAEDEYMSEGGAFTVMLVKEREEKPEETEEVSA